MLTGKPPKVLNALRFVPGPMQSGLSPIDIAGNLHYRVDPAHEDFYKRLIDLRREIQKRSRSTKPKQRSALEHEQLAVKNVANATTYGIFIELNVEDMPDEVSGICYGSGEAFAVDSKKFEQPGAFFHPLIAVFTTGAARLMLATAERLAKDAGLDWAFCDTDSMALAKPAAMSDPSFLKKAQAVRDWFTPLNPYAVKGPVFKIEDENFGLHDGKLTDKLEPLFCYCISPKRYALFNLDKNGRPIIRKAVAHGLGHLISPTERDSIPPSIPKPVVPLEKMEISAWQYSLWYRILDAGLSDAPDNPPINSLPGFRKPAATRYGASTPNVLAWCKGYNRGKLYRDQVRPFNFLLRFYTGIVAGGRPIDVGEKHPKRGKASTNQQLRPIAPFNSDAADASKNCFDRVTGETIASDRLSTYAQCPSSKHLGQKRA
ncbi:MAG: hypothetical protein RB191_19395 [Terriglobia bacterium]|nr:hypothetical protein [Terriglobia bacterium]